MRNIGYVIRCVNCGFVYVCSSVLSEAHVFLTHEAARQNKRKSGDLRIEKIFQVELTKTGRAKRIIKEVR